MKLKNIIIGVALFFTATICTISCVRERDTDTDIAEDNQLGEFIYNDALTIMDDASEKNTGETLSNYKTTSNCAVVTKTNVSGTTTIVVDFGAVNCLCTDGRNRRGKILLTHTGSYKDIGSVHEITFDNYFVNDNKVLGTKKITNMGKNTSNQTYFTLVTTGQVVKANSAGTVSWNANRTRNMIAGEGTAQWGDDVYEITGKGTGINSNGINYATNITKPLIRNMPLVCRFITQGTIEMQPQGKALRIIDYGTGACDNMATVTINNKVFNITLK